jgi:hypothetical protein
MNEPTPIRIRPKLYQEIKDEMPEIFADTTTWVNYLIQVGYNYHMGLDPCGRLKTDRQKEKKKEEREVFYTSKVENIINKEKTKKWIFRENQIPQEFHYCKDLIAKFWAVKSGAKSEEAFNILIGLKGLGGIHGKYGQIAVKDQLQEAIAHKWKSVLLKNYEAFGRPKNADKEPVTNHPAGRVFRNGRFVDE